MDSEFWMRMADDSLPPETLWIVVRTGGEGGNPPVEIIDDIEFLRFLEKPEDATVLPEPPAKAVLCKVSSSAIRQDGVNFYHAWDGVWLSDVISFPEPQGDSWSESFMHSRYTEYCVVLAGREWFDEIEGICKKWQVSPRLCSDSVSNLDTVEYMRSRGNPPDNRPVFPVCMLSENDYVFSDTERFYYAHIMNPWEWDSRYDKVTWRGYDRFEDLIPEYFYKDGSCVPRDYLPQAFFSLIRRTVPTMAVLRYMYTREEGLHGTAFLCAHYDQHNNTPHGVRAVTIVVGMDPDDPNTIEYTLISGKQEEIFPLLEKPEFQQETAAMCRRLLQQYEASYDEEAVMRRRREQEEQDKEFKIRKGILIKYNGSGSRVTVPEGVSEIGDKAFFRCKGLEYVSLPESVTAVGEDAFYECPDLEGIHLPDSLRKIGWGSFCLCGRLRDVKLPPYLTEIGQRAFYKCSSLTEAAVPNGVTEIDYAVFGNCHSLRKVILPDSLRKIDMNAFAGCTALAEISLPPGVAKINDSAFEDCSSLKIITKPGSYPEQWLREHPRYAASRKPISYSIRR